MINFTVPRAAITPLQRTVRVTGSPAGHLPHAFGSNRRLLQVLTDHDLPDSDSSNSTAVDGDEDSLWVSSLWDQPPAWLQVKNIVKAADANCPGCAEGSCVSTGDGFKCTVCMGTLMVSRADGSCGKWLALKHDFSDSRVCLSNYRALHQCLWGTMCSHGAAELT